MEYVLSKYLHHKEVSRGHHGIYNPLKDHQIVFLESRTYRALSQFNKPRPVENFEGIEPDILTRLIEGKFLVPADADQDKPIRALAATLPQNPRFVLMYMLLTDCCNLKCGYCFERGNEEPSKVKKQNMSPQTASNAISFFTRIVDPQPDEGHTVIFYGGEPFMNRAVFEHSTRELRAQEKRGRLKDLTMIVNTNGFGVDDSLARFCAEYQINPAVSIDGTKEIHDAVRKNANSACSSFEEATRAYGLFRSHGVKPGISCTISAKNVDQVEEIAKFLAEKLEPNGIGFNFLLDFKDRKNPLSTSIEKSTKKLIEAFKVLREKGIYEERIMRRVAKLINNKIHLKDCAGYGHQITVGPDGSLGPCQVFLNAGEMIVGNVNNNPPDPRNNAVFLEWNSRTPFEAEDCMGCSGITLCGGGCAYNAHVTEGSIWEKDERMCQHTLLLIDWMIEDIWERKSL
ncbi:MAG: SPASM domain-containing protein [Candidatus Woesearchaeota archaeon]